VAAGSKLAVVASVTVPSALGAGVAALAGLLAHGAGAAFACVLEATSVNAVSRTALTASGLESELGEDGLVSGDDGVTVGVGVGLGDVVGDVVGDDDGCEDGVQLGDGDGRRVPDPGPEPEWTGDAPGAARLVCLAGPGCPWCGCEFELLGDTAVETLIAT